MICKNCGRELPAESSFCPYCMTKFTEEVLVENTKPAKKSNKKLIIIIVSVVVAIALAVSGILIAQNSTKDKEENKKENATSSSSPSADSTDEPIFSLKNTDTALGVSCIKPHYTTVKLNETEKLLLDYFDTDYFTVDYGVLTENPDVYNNTQICFYGIVSEIVSQNGNKVTVLVEHSAYVDFSQIYYKSGNMALVKIDKNQSADIVGKTVNFYTTFKGVEKHNDDSLPSFDASRVTDYTVDDLYIPKYSRTEVEKVSQYFFGNKATLRQAQNEDFEFLEDDFYDDLSYSYFVADINGLQNKGFVKYGLAAIEGGLVIDCKTDESINRYMTFSGDFKNIYVHTYDWTANTFTFDCYDKSFNKLWSRHFDENAEAFMDFTPDCIYLNVGDKLYILDSESGENVVEAKTVGEHHAVRKLEDGILLVASGESGIVTKTDLDGNILWTKDITSNAYTADIQIIDEKYIVQFSSYDPTGAYYGNTLTTYVLKPDGTVEFSNQES